MSQQAIKNPGTIPIDPDKAIDSELVLKCAHCLRDYMCKGNSFFLSREHIYAEVSK